MEPQQPPPIALTAAAAGGIAARRGQPAVSPGAAGLLEFTLFLLLLSRVETDSEMC